VPPSLEALPKGHELPPSTFELTPEWVREYVASVEDGAIGALGGGLAPPMAVLALSVRSLLESASLPAGAVHLGQEVSFLRPLRAGERLSASARIVSRGERAGWVLIGIELSVAGEDGSPAMAGRATLTAPLDGGGA
jgi:acyl dehydratase